MYSVSVLHVSWPHGCVKFTGGIKIVTLEGQDPVFKRMKVPGSPKYIYTSNNYNISTYNIYFQYNFRCTHIYCTEYASLFDSSCHSQATVYNIVHAYKITSENPSLVTAGCEGDAATGSVPISGSCSFEGEAPGGMLGILCRYP